LASLSASDHVASFAAMRAEFNLGEIRRLTEKKQMFGEDALTDDELYTLGCFKAFTAVMKRSMLGRTEQERADRLQNCRVGFGCAGREGSSARRVRDVRSPPRYFDGGFLGVRRSPERSSI
jgi:hypothetical protein